MIPSDYNNDGVLDCMVQTYNNGSSHAVIHYGDRIGFTSRYDIPNPPESTVPVLLMDYNMDLKPDFFGVNSAGDRIFWVQQDDATFNQVPFPSTGTLNPISIPHSNAFVDINGDCLADLIIFSNDNTTSYMEIWALDGTTATLNQTITLPQGAGQVTFSDLNRDGTTDFVFPVCYPSKDCSEVNTIEVIYNVQMPMCTSIAGGGDNCIDSSNVCGVQYNYTIPDIIPTSSTADVVVIGSSGFNGTTLHWDYPLSTKAPNTLKIGDYDADGFPDLMVIVKLTNGSSSAQLWKSTACTSGLCGDDATNANRRTFVRDTSGSAVESVKGAYSGAFFDIGDDGTLDMIILGDTTPLTPRGGLQIVTVENAVNYGTFFLKTMGLSGKCMQWCDTGSKFPDPKPIGVNQPGGVFKYIWSDNNQEKRITMGTHLSQTGYLSLQTPYVFFGIGDVSHYIQQLYFGAPVAGGVSISLFLW